MDITQIDPNEIVHDKSQPLDVSQINPSEIEPFDPDKEKYETPGQSALALGEGLAKGFAGPVYTLGAKALTQMGVPGLTPEDQAKREKYQPGFEGVGNVAGFAAGMLTGTGEAGLIGSADSAIARTLIPNAETLAAKIGKHAVQGSAGFGMFKAGDKLSDFINDPNQSVPAAIYDVGMDSLLGAGVGTVFGAGSALWEKASAGKIGKFVEQFKDGVRQSLDHPDFTGELTKELKDYHADTTSNLDEVYGHSGIKAQAIADKMPVMNENISGQVESISQRLESGIKDLGDDPLSKKLQKEVDKWKSKVYQELPPDPIAPIESVTPDFSNIPKTVLKAPKPTASRVAEMSSAGSASDIKNIDEANKAKFNPYESQPAKISLASPSEIFDATQDLKQTLQSYAKFEKMAPIGERDFVKASKGISFDLRNYLEDSKVWGGVGDVQKQINSAFKEYLPSLEDFEKRFTVKSEAEGRIIDPGKIQTYLNQLGKPSAEIKQQFLRDFLDKSESYRKLISDIHEDLGLDNPFKEHSLNATRYTLKEINSGMKLANVLTRGSPALAGKALGAASGAGVGSVLGHAGIGALIGEHALGPMFEKLLPTLVKPLLEKSVSPEGFKDAIAFGSAAQKGKEILDKSIRSLFNPAIPFPAVVISSLEGSKKLDENVRNTQTDPGVYEKVGNKLGDYFPDHAVAVKTAAIKTAQYLNTLRPKSVKDAPLDKDRHPTSIQNQEYNRALKIAQQPLYVISLLKDGRLTPQDINHLSNLHPESLQLIRNRVTQELVSHLAKGKEVPYSQRSGMSLILGKPLDSSFFPQHIASNQTAFSVSNQATNQAPVKQPSMKAEKLKGAGRLSLHPSEDQQ